VTELLAPGTTLECVFSGEIDGRPVRWGEGPVWMPDASRLRWSDIPNDRILEFDAATGTTRVHRTGVEFTNGRTLDRHGVVVQCSHGRRSIEYEIDGEPTTIADNWDGLRFNSPNDIVVASDDTIWFSDPSYGIDSDIEGHAGEREYGGCFVFRYDPLDGSVTAVITDRIAPNGLAFSPDERILYVSDTCDDERARIWAYPVDLGAGIVGAAREFARPRPGASDGFRVDAEGRIWSSARDAVHVFASDGEPLLRIPVPEPIANLCFGGDDGHDLYVTATSSLYRIRTTTTQAERP
jgi:gluconolactonase